MTWFEDLTPYSYLREPRGARAVNVGWLEAGHPFARGPVPAALIARLWLLEEHSQANVTRGFHYCDLCPGDDNSGPCGHGEIWALGADGTRFAAPSLIAHYVQTHSYRPPNDFIAAILRVASLTLEEATAKDLCLSCGSPLIETSRHTTGSASGDAASVTRSFECDGCGCDYRR